MMRLIEDVLDTKITAQCQKTGRWLPAVGEPYPSVWLQNLRDAWEVLRGRAHAVRWPDQEQSND